MVQMCVKANVLSLKRNAIKTRKKIDGTEWGDQWGTVSAQGNEKQLKLNRS